MNTESTPQDLLLQRAMPVLTKVIEDRFNAQEDLIRNLLAQNEKLIAQNEQLRTEIADLSTGRARLPVRLVVDITERNRTVASASNVSDTTSTNTIASTETSTVTVNTFSEVNRIDNDNNGNGNGNSGNGSSSNSNDSNDSNSGELHQSGITTTRPHSINHSWSRGIETIPDLWREYTVGLANGYAIRDLNRNHPKWFLPHDKNFHYRRMRIINGLEKHVKDKNLDMKTFLKTAETKRLALGRVSLHSLGKSVQSIDRLLH